MSVGAHMSSGPFSRGGDDTKGAGKSGRRVHWYTAWRLTPARSAMSCMVQQIIGTVLHSLLT